MRHLLACALLLGACGPSSFGDFRSQLTARWCDHQIHCGQVGASQRSRCGVPEPLRYSVTGIVDVPASISAGRMQFHSDAAQSCLDAIGGAPCDPMQAESTFRWYCHNVVAPNVGTGGACYGSEECVGGECVATVPGCAGICVRYALPGAPCVANGGAPDHICDPTVHYCDGNVCQHKKHGGDSCTTDIECAFNLFCVGGKCADPPFVAQGQPCSATMMLPPCAVGLYCNSATGLCAPRVARGAACTQIDGCSDGLVCQAGTCAAWLDVGAACASNGCPATQFCSSFVCTSVPGPVGPRQSCKTNGDCADGLWCGSGICQWQSGQDGVCTVAGGGCYTGLMCDPGLRCRESLSCPSPQP